MARLSDLVSKLKLERPLKYGRDFTVEQLGMGSYDGPPKKHLIKNEESAKKAIKKMEKKPVCTDGHHCSPEDNLEKETKLFIVKGFTERVLEYSERQGFNFG